VSGLEVRYGTAVAVQNVSFAVPEGSVLALLGANGAGKSTVARACAGLVPPVAGDIWLGSARLTGLTADQIRRSGLVYVPEGRGIFPSLTVAENLRLAVRLAADRPQATERAISLFPVLGQRLRQRAGSLSGGEQQMLSLARALAVESRVVIVDEVSLGLAPRLVSSVFESLREAKRHGLTMIIIEQFARHALALADNCVILRRGTTSWAGPASSADQMLAEHYLGGAPQGIQLRGRPSLPSQKTREPR